VEGEKIVDRSPPIRRKEQEQRNLKTRGTVFKRDQSGKLKFRAVIMTAKVFMIKGQKVVCVDDKVEPTIRRLYEQWIRKGTTYVIRDVMLAQNRKGEWGEVGLLLQGIVNPTQSVPPFQERSFNSERFRPIEDKTLTETVEAEQHAVL
jgi:hypothetical protein